MAVLINCITEILNMGKDYSEELYGMKLHDEICPWNGLRIIRVPGGWLYFSDCETGTGGYSTSGAFVRFDNEYQDRSS